MVKVVTKEVYEATDGSIFDSKEKAERHEKDIQNMKYFLVMWGADLTEGRSWYNNKSYIAVNTGGSHYEFAEILCFSKFGTPSQFCQGVFGSNAIMPYWKLQVVDKLDSNIKIEFAVEDRFVNKKIYGEGLWDLTNKDKKKIQLR
jgi:hypothetical protein